MKPGEIILNPRHYADSITGELKPKYFLVLAQALGDDLIVRLLTSRQHGRPEEPPCSHADPYPAYFLGILGKQLPKKTWLDLRAHPDLDAADVRKGLGRGTLKIIMQVSDAVLDAAMDCAANAPDTVRYQEVAMRDLLATRRSQRNKSK